MTPNLCRAYKLIVPPQGEASQGVVEICEFPTRAHLLLSFTNQEIPGGVGVMLNLEMVTALRLVLMELEGRMDKNPTPAQTRSITLEEIRRADELESPF